VTTNHSSEENAKMPVFSQAGTVSYNTVTPMHLHPCCEIVYIERGGCRVDAGSVSYELQKGDLLVVAARIEHNQIPRKICRNSFLTFVAPSQFFEQHTRLIHAQGDIWVPQLMRMISSMAAGRAYELCDGVLLSLLKQIKRVEQQQQNLYALPQALTVALNLIEENYADELLIHKLPEACRVSSSYLRLLFQSHMKCSPQEYLQNYRMGEARKLLRQPYLETAEIAQQCGYPNANYFARLFKKIHGCTPTEFRTVEKLWPEKFVRF